MSTAENKHTLGESIDRVWNHRAIDVLDELFAVDATIWAGGVPFPDKGPAWAKDVVARFCKAFPDIRMSVDDMVAEGDKVALRWSAHGTHQGEFQGIAPTHRHVTVNGMAIYRFAAGKVVEEWINTDNLGMLRQLGVIS